MPLLMVLALFLAKGRRWRALAAMVGAFAAILLLKLLFGAVPSLGAPIEVRSPSGHTACAAATYGGLALLLAGRRFGAVAAILVAAVIGATRIGLGLHTLPEVLIGGAVGVGAVLAAGPRASGPPRVEAMLLLTLALVIVAVGHGRHASIEPALIRIERAIRV